ncbi:MAG: gamma-glutamyl kinase [Pseudomonadota bacterium]
MIVSMQHRLVILSMPKCATHSLIDALGMRADMVIRHPQGAKHCNYRKFHRHLRPFLEKFSDQPLETVCLFREPVDWLHSWWRYRQRDALRGHRNSTVGLSFDTFVNRYFDKVSPGDTLGRQSRFVADAEGGIGVDHLYRYDHLADMVAWIGGRTGWEIELGRLNVSPQHGSRDLASSTRQRVSAELARDFEIYESMAR